MCYDRLRRLLLMGAAVVFPGAVAKVGSQADGKAPKEEIRESGEEPPGARCYSRSALLPFVSGRRNELRLPANVRNEPGAKRLYHEMQAAKLFWRVAGSSLEGGVEPPGAWCDLRSLLC